MKELPAFESRDSSVDFLRAASVLMVVIFHILYFLQAKGFDIGFWDTFTGRPAL